LKRTSSPCVRYACELPSYPYPLLISRPSDFVGFASREVWPGSVSPRPNRRHGDAVLAALKDASRRLWRWPSAILDRGCARRPLRGARSGRRNGPSGRTKKLSPRRNPEWYYEARARIARNRKSEDRESSKIEEPRVGPRGSYPSRRSCRVALSDSFVYPVLHLPRNPGDPAGPEPYPLGELAGSFKARDMRETVRNTIDGFQFLLAHQFLCHRTLP
jgi:hypothetical protein